MEIQELSRIEIKISELVTKDFSNKIIAEKLFKSINTVRNHIANITKKLKVHTRVGIAVKYVQSLDNPRSIIISSFLLIIQLGIIFNTESQDFRRSRKVKIVRRMSKKAVRIWT